MNTKLSIKLAISALVALPLLACEYQVISDGESFMIHQWDTSGMNPAVCNPLGADNDRGSIGGLIGKLYLDTSNSHSKKVDDYITKGVKLPVDLFFNNINVPTRPFDRGFVTDDKRLIVTPTGDTLYEWFGLNLKTRIKLGANDPEGKYQFALLADDGAMMKIASAGDAIDHILINNDGEHETKLGCALETVDMTKDSALVSEFNYYQGPRYHIAFILLWRHVPDTISEANLGAFLNDSQCGKAGNDMYFNSKTEPPTPTATYKSLLTRGWKVVSPDNFKLPTEVPFNPCAEENWSIAGRECFTEITQNTVRSEFPLSKDHVDANQIFVRINDTAAEFTYDQTTNSVTLKNPSSELMKVTIDYCTVPETMQECTGWSCSVLGI